VRFTAYTGLRAGEVAALRVGRVNVLAGTIEVAASVSEDEGNLIYLEPKTYERRTVPMPRALAHEMGVYLGTRPSDPDALVFVAPEGGPLRRSNFYNRHFKPGVLRTDLPDRVRFHDLQTHGSGPDGRPRVLISSL
jgi:integrase